MEEGTKRGRGREAEDDRRGVEDSDVGRGHGGARRHRSGAGYRRRRGGAEARRRSHLTPVERASREVAHWTLDSQGGGRGGWMVEPGEGRPAPEWEEEVTAD